MDLVVIATLTGCAAKGGAVIAVLTYLAAVCLVLPVVGVYCIQ